MPAENGNIFKCNIVGYKKGEKGSPGELRGLFLRNGSILGSLDKNNEFGVYGTFYEKNLDKFGGSLIEVANKDEVKSGKAQIRCAIDGFEPDYYDIEIVKTYFQTTKSNKSMFIRVTDKRLLETTGGIVQGKVLGNGSKAVNCEKDFAFTGGKLTALVDGAISTDGSSAAGIKCTGNCTITDGTIGVNCTGVGAKAINADGNVIIDNGSITLLSTGENYNEGADDKKSRAVSALSYTQNGGNVLAKSYDKAIAAATVISLSKGILNAFSASDYALGVAATQTGGWVLTKDGKE
jgi:hypothetical protein